MKNLEYLNHFKQSTDEESIIAQLVVDILTEFDCRSLLDVGAGSGLIASKIKDSLPLIEIEAIEPYVRIKNQHIYRNIYRTPIEEFKINRKYDSKLLSHFLCYINKDFRKKLVIELLSTTSKVLLCTMNVMQGKFSKLQNWIWEIGSDFSYDMNMYEIFEGIPINLYAVPYSTTLKAENNKQFYNTLQVLSPVNLPINGYKNEFLNEFCLDGQYVVEIPQCMFVLTKKDIVTAPKQAIKFPILLLKNQQKFWEYLKS